MLCKTENGKKKKSRPDDVVDRDYFFAYAQHLFSQLKEGEYLIVDLKGESTHYCRLNGAKIRQSGWVLDHKASLTLLTVNLIVDPKSQDPNQSQSQNLKKPNQNPNTNLSTGYSQVRRAQKSHTLTHDLFRDQEWGTQLLGKLQEEAPTLSVDPFASLPSSTHTSESLHRGKLLEMNQVPEALLETELDLVGLYTSGSLKRGNATSKGAFHWFESDSFLLDYSLYGPNERACKGFLGGATWNQEQWTKELKKSRRQMEVLAAFPRSVQPGEYRVYLAPAAVGELLNLLLGSSSIFSELRIRQGDSPLRLLRLGEHKLSPQLSISDDFSQGDSPRFTNDGDILPNKTTLIEGGQLKSTLINHRTAREYGLMANRASSSESVRAPLMGPGNLADSNILPRLDCGIYISNLHYLNWSDQAKGRVTGMTRYACFWVEKGRLQEPMEHMRWDDTLFRILGSELEDLTKKVVTLPHTGSYGNRSVGAYRCPGLLLKSMRFTL